MRLSFALRSLNWERSWLFLALTLRAAQMGEHTACMGRAGVKLEPQWPHGLGFRVEASISSPRPAGWLPTLLLQEI